MPTGAMTRTTISQARQIYRWLHAHLPPVLADLMSQLLYMSGFKPIVYSLPETSKSASLNRGVVLFSIDFELAWAFRFSRTRGPRYKALALREREQVPRILAMLDSFSIPATWATVGHLFLESCRRGSNHLPHPE